MKVKEAIKLLLDCDPNYDLAYEHCYVDYIKQLENEKLVEMGDLRPIGYSRWIPLSKREPDDCEFPVLFALKDPDGEWKYYISDHFFMGIGTAAKSGGLWMPIERTKEDKLKRIGLTQEQINKIIEFDKNG